MLFSSVRICNCDRVVGVPDLFLESFYTATKSSQVEKNAQVISKSIEENKTLSEQLKMLQATIHFRYMFMIQLLFSHWNIVANMTTLFQTWIFSITMSIHTTSWQRKMTDIICSSQVTTKRTALKASLNDSFWWIFFIRHSREEYYSVCFRSR